MNLMQGDCLELMKTIPDKSVDMILCDLPYGTTACKWDTVIPFEPLWEQYKRSIKRNGAIVLFGSEPFSSALRMSNLKMYKYDWVWIKNRPTGFAHAKNKPMKKHEIISIFSTGMTIHANQTNNKMPYFPQGISKMEPKKINRNKLEYTDSCFSVRPSHREFTRDTTNFPNSILEFKTDQRGEHPTQKPVALLEYLIKTYTLEGELVLDNTMGSGSTGVACVNTNRNFIGIELDKKYFEIAKKRIEEAQENKKFFGAET